MTDVEQLAAALRPDFAALTPAADRAWSRATAVQLLDCVLSLRRADGRGVSDRLDAFERRFPAVEQLPQLRSLLGSYKSPALFAKDVLDLPEPSSVTLLKALLDYLIRTVLDGPGAEVERLRLWAQRARPQDYLALHIPGMGLAGFQHLRMLYGANTTRPDALVSRYVATAIGRPVADVQSLRLLEEAAPLARIQLRDIDAAAWEAGLQRRRTAS
ncbi:MAG TPA: hypothetical protein VLD58_15295 [Gemmatimonadales bacterium]|nr:hypothetical protein [Gemmatimonadales bacterium]